MEVKRWIFDWFQQYTHEEVEELQKIDDSNYFECGLIDSISFVMLLSEVEEVFKISFDEKSFQSEKFFSIAGLIHIIEEKRDEQNKLHKQR